MRNLFMFALCLVSTQIWASNNSSALTPTNPEITTISEPDSTVLLKHPSCKRGPRGHRGPQGHRGLQGHRGKRGHTGHTGQSVVSVSGRAYLLIENTNPILLPDTLNPTNPYIVPLTTQDAATDPGIFTTTGTDSYFTVPSTGKYLINYSLQLFANYSEVSSDISGTVSTVVSVTGANPGWYGLSKIAPVWTNVNTAITTYDTVAYGTGQALIDLTAGDQIRLVIIKVPINQQEAPHNEQFSFDVLPEVPSIINEPAWLSILKVG